MNARLSFLVTAVEGYQPFSSGADLHHHPLTCPPRQPSVKSLGFPISPNSVPLCLSGEGPEYGPGGEDALTRIQRLMAEGGMTAVVQREQSTTMASMGGFGNNIIVSHRIHRSSQTGAEPGPSDSAAPQPSTSRGLAPEPEGRSLRELGPVAERGLSQRTGPARLASPSTVGPISYGHLTDNNHLSDSTGCPSGEPRDR